VDRPPAPPRVPRRALRESGSAISAAADAAWLGDLPVDSLWIAAWTGTPALTGFAGLPDTSWSRHQRIHQWGRDHSETWGGVTLNIDSSFVDGLSRPEA